MPEAANEALPRLSSSDLVLVSVLGEGATARVYRAWQVESGQWCAVKVLKRDKTDKVLRRFLAEGRLLCELEHRNLIKGYQLVDGSPAWFSMEIADGGSLKDWTVKHGRMAPRLAVDVAIQICKGVAVAHQAGFVHRDIKPHNVLISRRGICKLSDFGVARFERMQNVSEDPDVSSGSDALGTLVYMAPEQQSDPASVDQRSDVYGVGATLLHLLLGDTPPGNLFMATREYPELFSAIPDALVPVLQRSTEYKRADRYPTAIDLARALHSAAEFLPAVGNAPSLTSDIAVEPMPPPGMSSRTPPSVPSVDSGPASVPGLITPLVPTVVPRADVGTPTPRSLVRTDMAPAFEAEPPRTRWGLVVLIVIVQAFLAFSLDVYWVGTARQAADTTEPAFHEATRRHAAVIDDLATAGADRQALERALGATRVSTPKARVHAARAWVDALEGALAANPPAGRQAVVVESRVAEIHETLGPWSDAIDEWERRSTTFPGVLVSPLLGTPGTAVEGGR